MGSRLSGLSFLFWSLKDPAIQEILGIEPCFFAPVSVPVRTLTATAVATGEAEL